jgi:divalent metal cation (Fe/Co/Zn/Cd) transporter
MGLGLLAGGASTQLADFTRRTAELLAILVSYFVFRQLHRNGDPDPARKASLEHTVNSVVGVAMCLSGAAMLLVALLSIGSKKGNVIPGLIIAVLGVITNTWFWFRYKKLDREKPDAILAAQSKLYRAKSLVDTCVTIVLIVVAVDPASEAARYMDLIGSAVVAGYLLVNGVMMLRGKQAAVKQTREKDTEEEQKTMV